MDVQNSQIAQEISRISASGIKQVAHGWQAVIHCNGNDFPMLYVTGVEVEKDFTKNYGEVRSVTGMMTAGVLNYQIVPNKSNLTVTLIKTPMLPGTPQATVSKKAPLNTFLYRGQLWNSNSELLTGNMPVFKTQNIADRTMLVPVKIMLLDPVLEKIRLRTVGGIFRKCSGVDLCRVLLGIASQGNGDDTAVAVKGVDLAPGFNTTVMDHIPIPHSKPIMDVPRLIESLCGGIYPTGFNFYLQNQIWYLYSPYALQLYAQSKSTLTVINVPAGRMGGIDNSYRTTNTQVIILATGDTKHLDKSESAQLNLGNGVRFIDAKTIMSGFVKTGLGKAIITAAKNFSEFIAIPRKTGLNNVQESLVRITANYNKEYSKLAERAGAHIQVMWEASDDSLIYPGMPCKYMYLQDNIVEEIFGIVVNCHSVDQPTNHDVKATRFISRTALTLFINCDTQFAAQLGGT
jgi:hypothetical protein